MHLVEPLIEREIFVMEMCCSMKPKEYSIMGKLAKEDLFN